MTVQVSISSTSEEVQRLTLTPKTIRMIVSISSTSEEVQRFIYVNKLNEQQLGFPLVQLPKKFKV